MKKYYSLLLFFAVAGLSSCLKQNPALDPKQGNNVLEIYSLIPTPTGSPADAVYPLYNQAFEIMPSVDFEVQVNYAGAETAPQDITVTLALDQQAMIDYNDEQGTSLVFTPATFYTVDSWTVTIPKGQRLATMTVSFKTNQFDPSTTYAFPVKIVSASFGTISSNFGTVIFALSAKNKYDGVYNLRCRMTDWTAYSIANTAWNWPDEEIWMVTTSGNTVNMYSTLHGSYIHVATTVAGGLTGFGFTNPRLTFDLSSNAMTNASNDYSPITNGRVFLPNPAVTTSRWDPPTGDIYASMILKQNGRPDLVIYDTLRYVGPRP